MIVTYKFEVQKRHRGKKELEVVRKKPKIDGRMALQESRAARRLALAHFIERAIESGQIKDYADAARKLGVTRARLTQVMDSAVAPVAEQEAVLVGAGAM